MSIRKSTTSPVSGTDRADLNDSFAVSEAEPSQLHGHVEYGADVSVGVEDASGFTAEDAFQVGGEEDEEQVSTVTNGAVVPQSVVAAESADEDAVSYTHLDVYKRQVLEPVEGSSLPVEEKDLTEGSLPWNQHHEGEAQELSLIHI